MTNHYDVLGVAKTASQDDIKKAYKKLAQKHHPDRPSGSASVFKEINTAYQTLKNPEKREEYDNPQPQVDSRQYSYRTGDVGPDDLERMIREAMSGQGFGRQRYRMVNIQITLEESFAGTTRTLDGKQFAIPAGVRSGNQLLVDEIMVVINVVRHAKFKRSNDDLLAAVQINAVEAMLGIECNITNIDGKVIKVKIPAGLQHGQLVRAAGMGMPNPEYHNHRGDLLVQVAVTIPKSLTDDEKESIMKLQHRKSFDA